MVHILIDSTADIPVEEAKALGITVAPLTVRIDGAEYKDGLEMPPARFFPLLESCKEFPTTSQMNSGSFLELYQSLLQNPEDEILGVFLSSKLSGTYQSACIAKNSLPRQPIYLIDGGSASVGTDLLIREALRLRDKGRSAREIVAELNRIKGKLRILITPGSLKYLLKGGRLSPTSALMGTLLQVKPVLSLKDGKIEVLKKVRGNLAAYQWIAEYLHKNSFNTRYTPRLASTQCPELLQLFTEKLQGEGICTKDFGHTDVGVVIGSHVGPGCVGIAFFERA